MAIVRKRTRTHADGTQKISWLVDYVDAAGTRRFQTFYRKKDADARLTDIQSELKLGTHTASRGSITVAKAAELWLEDCRTREHPVERATLRNYRTYVERHIVPLIGRVKLAELTTPGVVDFRTALAKRIPGHPVTVRKVMIALKSLLALAQLQGRVAQNVAIPVKFEKNSRVTKQLKIGVDVPDPDEVERLLAAAEGRWYPFLLTAVRTGLRSSELRGLTWKHVDLGNKVLHVEQRADRWGTIGLPKSKAGTRDVPLTPELITALREWKLASPKTKPADLVFPTLERTIHTKTGTKTIGGRPMLHANVCNLWLYPLQRRLGIVDDAGHHKYGLHAFRHFYASWLIAEEFPPKTVQTWMGHSTISMTFDTYGTFMKKDTDHDKLAEAEKRMMRRITGN